MGTAKRERQKANRALRQAEENKQDQRDRRKRRIVRIGIIVVLIVAAVIAITLIAGGDDEGEEATEPTTGEIEVDDTADQGDAATEFTYGDGECAPDEKPTGDDRRRPAPNDEEPDFGDAPQECIDPAASYSATFETSEGTIEVELDTEQVPGTVNNFVNLARWGYYDDTTIFRGDHSIGIIQGGGTSNTDGPGYTIPDEGGDFTYEAGQLVMARTQEPDSGGGQWFFNANDDASALDAQGTYVVFGNVTEGQEVVEEILSVFPQDDDMNPEREITLDEVTITES